MTKLYVIFYDPGYGDQPYVKGVFSSPEAAKEAMSKDPIYKHSKTNLDYNIEEHELDQLY